MTTPSDNYGLSSELKKHTSENLAYFNKLLSKKIPKNAVAITSDDIRKIEKSFEIAHRIREFEIGLYWQRLNFLWAITTLIFAGWGALLFKAIDDKQVTTPSLLLASLLFISLSGCFVTIFTSFITASGRYWQRVWEYHILTLEPFVSGCLYSIDFKHKQRKSISRTVEFFNLTLLFIWISSAMLSMFLYLKNGNSSINLWDAGISFAVVSVVIGAAFLLISSATSRNKDEKLKFEENIS